MPERRLNVSDNKRLLTVSFCRTRLQQIDEELEDNDLSEISVRNFEQNRDFFAKQLEIALKKEGFK
ncbi:MAG TPA: hypothetical protein VMU26_00710 [Candidatus Polarisedimenticolia bacterium]|nr:hypothetical protein [Candidatus Polarisedimenticolia bacterium]